jgi:tetratricopeptide (TPR) repeat protein
VRELELALALARRNLNPQVEVSDLSDIAVAEIARGNYDRSDQLFSVANTMLEKYPDGLFEAHTCVNCGELALTRGNLERAAEFFHRANDRSIALDLMTIALQATAGLALVAQRRGDNRELANWCTELQRIGKGAEGIYHERWMLDAAVAWNIALNNGSANDAIDFLVTAARRLKRRDIDHWLSIEVELLRLRQECTHGASPSEILRVREAAHQYKALGVLIHIDQLCGSS